MAGIKCATCNKFYNPDRFSSCPFCSAGNMDMDSAPDKAGESSVTGALSQKDANINSLIQKALEKEPGGGKTVSFFGGLYAADDHDSSMESDEDKNTEDFPVQDLRKDLMNPDASAIDQETMMDSEEPFSDVDSASVQDGAQPRPQPQPQPHTQPQTEPEAVIERRKFTNTANDDEGKTWGYFKAIVSGREHSSNAPVESAPVQVGNGRPVVGWLVCVKGIYFGSSFAFYEGNNTIGRGSGNDIVFSEDQSISRDIHLNIIFDAKKNDYYVRPGTGHAISRLNDTPIMEVRALAAYDLLEIGEETMVFVPLCGERFNWNQYIF